MEAGKDLVPLLLSALALGSLLLWNFLIGRLAYWTGCGAVFFSWNRVCRGLARCPRALSAFTFPVGVAP